ncbi:MAG: oxidoreductase, partial [Bacteroidetes bacterium]
VSTFEGILQDPAIELVVVNTPEPTHSDLTRRALLAGKHVVVEKAFTPTVAEADELIELAQKQKRILSVYHNRRWDSDFLTVSQVIRQGLLGRLVNYEAHYDRYRNFIQESWKEQPAPGTSILFNLGSHLIDQALQLFGLPEALWADLRIERSGGQVPDAFDLVLFYEGFRARLRASYLVREPGPRYRVDGTLGSFVKHGLDPQEEALKVGIQPGSPGWGMEPESIWGDLHTEREGLVYRGKIESLGGDYRRYYQELAPAIRKKSAPPVTAAQARDVIQLIEHAQKSAATRQVIKL